MELTAEQIIENWSKFTDNIEEYITGDRKEKLLEFYNKHEDRVMMMPASHKPQYHSCFPGGYVYHVNKVVEASIKLHNVWKEMGMHDTYTLEELVFSAINHDLGKFGDDENESYIEQKDQWRRDKLGEKYVFNSALEFMSVPDRSLWLLTSNGISYTKNEMLAIRLHDGLYAEANKAYLVNFNGETKPRTSIVYVLHHADMLAARIEFEDENLSKPVDEKIDKKAHDKKVPIKTKALKSVGGKGLDNAVNSFFN